MKIVYFIILFLFVSIMPSHAVDDVYHKGTLTSGKIFAYSDGLIQIKVGGMDYSIVRTVGNDFYGDVITYKERPIRGGVVSKDCRIIYIDRFYVTFKTDDLLTTEIPRYRVSSIVINAN